MEENRKKPQIRFAGYTDDWEQRKLSEIYASIGNAFVGTATPYYVEQGHFYLESNNIKDGQINHNSEVFINDEFYERQKEKWLHTGDMVMVQSGHVGHAAVIPEELDNSAAHALIMFREPKEKIEPYFLNYQYQTNKIKKKIDGITTGNTIKHILASDMQEFVVDLPDYNEQKQIGDYFRNLDNLITLHQRKYNKLVDVKKSMLEKMFPKNGEKKPEIRFGGFTDDWEQRKLGEYVSITSGEAPSKFEEGTELYVKVDDLNYNDKYVVDTQNKVAEHSTVKRVTKGSVVFPKRGAAIMTNKVRIMGIDSYMDTNMMALTSEKLDSEFLYNIISKEGLYKIADTSTIPQINNKHIEPYEVTIPSLDEQRRIGAYFRSLDHLITLHQREVEKLKNNKKSMLEKMFI